MFDALWEFVFATIGGVVLFLVNLLRSKLNKLQQENELLEDRLRVLEMDCVKEDKVRQLIEDALSPVRVTQGEIKEDIKETKQDIKELLRLQLQRRERFQDD